MNNKIFKGIDISSHNGVVDWNLVKQSGIDFAIIRLGWTWYDGGLDIDKNFELNIKNAQKNNIDVGIYVYGYDKTPKAAKISAERVVNIIKDYRLTYPVIYDMEELKLSGYTKNSKDYNSEIANAFLSVIDENRYYSMLYTFTSFAISYLNMGKLANYDVWIADYRGKERLDADFKHPYGIWQYAGSNGRCDGVRGACDRNYAYKNYAEIIKRAELNHLDNSDIENTTDIEKIKEELQNKEEVINTLKTELNNFRNKYISFYEDLDKIIGSIN